MIGRILVDFDESEDSGVEGMLVTDLVGSITTTVRKLHAHHWNVRNVRIIHRTLGYLITFECDDIEPMRA
jgi:hypothetical protein